MTFSSSQNIVNNTSFMTHNYQQLVNQEPIFLYLFFTTNGKHTNATCQTLKINLKLIIYS